MFLLLFLLLIGRTITICIEEGKLVNPPTANTLRM